MFAHYTPRAIKELMWLQSDDIEQLFRSHWTQSTSMEFEAILLRELNPSQAQRGWLQECIDDHERIQSMESRGMTSPNRGPCPSRNSRTLMFLS